MSLSEQPAAQAVGLPVGVNLFAPTNPTASSKFILHLGLLLFCNENRITESGVIPFLFQSSNNHAGCIPCTLAVGAWNAPPRYCTIVGGVELAG